VESTSNVLKSWARISRIDSGTLGRVRLGPNKASGGGREERLRK